ncbi:TRADD-N-associated membrane domain-containing protein [Streptomyces mirabilis]|uniref:TRADD-N-associated membrane domain-containing protein n=1 Tax=Streptomyces mirabilis TaxID=68239 RepID=UPI0022539318|nr:hypothetical protein [Streptomyces mirabilis]MCX4612113.1 hypothetical protein [Streptomyces mirabilis]
MRINPWTLAFALGGALVASAVTFLISRSSGQSWGSTIQNSFAVLIAAFTVIGLLLPASGAASLEPDDVRESRERVRDAERGLEAALSEGASRSHEGRPETPDEERRDAHRLALALLWEVTYSKLELYHKIATRQARMSFWSAQLAMILGFGLLGLFVAVAYNASTTAGAIVAGGLGAVSAALAGFISKTFVRSQETAAGHLKSYFDQPLEFSRFLAAERLVADSDMTQEQRAAITAELARAIVARPGTAPDAVGKATAPEANGTPTS